MQQLLALLGPLLDFHKSIDSASDNDLRMYWDVRLVRGRDTPFMSTSGSSSMPGILSGSARNDLPTVVYQEVEAKVATTLLAQLQDLASEATLAALANVSRPVIDVRAVSVSEEQAVSDAMAIADAMA